MSDQYSVERIRPEDVFLTSLHFLFIVFSYAFAFSTEWYWGAAMIVVHATHERLVGDCVLSRIQKNRGYSGPDDDYFYHLFRRLGFTPSRRLTGNLHLFIKTTILLVVVFKLVRWFRVF